jgi:hypothetical protein
VQPSLAVLEETLLSAHHAAANADRLASIAIRVFVKKRVEAATALSEARGMMESPEEFLSWLGGLGIGRQDAEAALAERWETMSMDERRREALPVLIDRQRGRAVTSMLPRTFDKR